MEWHERENLLERVANAALFGSLGLFVGSGFSKALTNGNAPSFKELLEQVCADLGIVWDFDDPDRVRGRSYPSLAQEMCAQMYDAAEVRWNRNAIEFAASKFKRAVAFRCELSPDPELATRYRDVLRSIPIQWIATTNYDFLLEHVVDNHTTLLPSDIFNPRYDRVPIYHLHGHRRQPESIVVSQSDYVSLLGPLEYAQLRLVVALTESATVMLGYSLGDINVQTAMEWSRRFRAERKLGYALHQGLVVQVAFKRESPREEPYLGPAGQVVVETASIADFLEELSAAIDECRESHSSNVDAIARALDERWSPSNLVSDPGAFHRFVSMLQLFPKCYVIQRVIEVLDEALQSVWQKSQEPLAFEYYDEYLKMLLKILERVSFDNLHPSLCHYLAERLGDVSYYLEPDPDRTMHSGQGFAASRTWQTKVNSIPDETLNELRAYALVHEHAGLCALLDVHSLADLDW